MIKLIAFIGLEFSKIFDYLLVILWHGHYLGNVNVFMDILNQRVNAKGLYLCFYSTVHRIILLSSLTFTFYKQ